MFNVTNREERKAFEKRLIEFLKKEGFTSVNIEAKGGTMHTEVSWAADVVGSIARQKLRLQVDVGYDADDR